jgi:uncharacterized HAD superfamily protein/adenine/guanine phosphoribosyltransferase-like PRPP-binding protein
MLNYRSFADLDRCVITNLWQIPGDVDLVVGIPRSGLMVANILALHLNKPLTALREFLEGRILSCGRRLSNDWTVSVASARKIAIVDDSIASGYEIRRTRALVEAAGLGSNVIYIAVYAAPETSKEVDIYFEICPLPRVFAWNLMHREGLGQACVDIDGVLCVDPREEDNDDGPCYERFLSCARPLLHPTCEIGTLVTCRLERYRAQTERWLQQQGIQYRELVMWDLPSKAVRIAKGGHADFKASVYSARPRSELFIESSAAQAQRIAALAFKPVICIETQRSYHPGTRDLIVGAARNSPTWSSKGMRQLLERLCRAR